MQAELREPAAHAVAARTAAALGRPGAVLLGGEVEPLVLRVRLFWDAGDVEVRDARSGRYVRVEGAGFAPGAEVVADLAAETVTVGRALRCELVELGSDFFALEPGACELEFSGCTAHEVRFYER